MNTRAESMQQEQQQRRDIRGKSVDVETREKVERSWMVVEISGSADCECCCDFGCECCVCVCDNIWIEWCESVLGAVEVKKLLIDKF